MSRFRNLLSSDSSDSDWDDREEAPQTSADIGLFGSQQGCCESQDLKAFTVNDVEVKKEDEEMNNMPFFEPDIKDIKPKVPLSRKRKLSALEAMEKERCLLRRSGQNELADFLFRKNDLIRKHVENADQIGMNGNKDLESIRSFIEERFHMLYGPTSDNPLRGLSDDETDEQKFLDNHSDFIINVILRMNDLEPDDYAEKVKNFYLMARNKVFLLQRNIREKEIEEMEKKRQLMFDRFRARENYLARVRDGEASSDDDDFDESDEDEVAKNNSFEEDYEEIISRAKALKLDMPTHRINDHICDIRTNSHLRSTPPPRVRCASPPREVISEDGIPMDTLWESDEASCNEEVKAVHGSEEQTLIEVSGDRDLHGYSSNCPVAFLSEEFFPDTEVKPLCKIRPLDVINNIDVSREHRAVDEDGCVKQEPIESHPAPLQSCLKPKKELATDFDETEMTLKQRIRWREMFEHQSSKKKSVRFREFGDPMNECRFFTRLTDVSCPHPSMEDNQLRDFGALPRYMNCTLVDGHPIIRNYMTRYQPIAASHSHNPDKYIRDLSSRYVGINVEKEYLRYHPRSFLVADIVESNLADGIRLPAHPGIAAAEIADLARFRAVPEEQRLFMLKYFRYDMLSNRQNRSGISVPRHLERARRVTGILFLSDSLLMHVEMLKLSNALLERFSTTQGVEDMIAIINRCSYEELDIRHCVLAWGHDLIVYLKNDAVDAVGRTICVLLHLHKAFERKKLFFEQEGYRKRNAPQFWLITIPEVGYFAQQFKVFNKTVRFFTAFREDFHLLDWALLVKSDCSANTLQNLFTKEAVERRFRQLFELCRHELDLTFCQFQEEKSQERLKSWRNKDYDCI